MTNDPNRTLEEFKKQMKALISTSSQAYTSRPSKGDAVRNGQFNPEDIQDIIQLGNPIELREISRHFYRYSGLYKRAITYYSTLLTYDTMLMPKIPTKAKNKPEKLREKFWDALQFLDLMNLVTNLPKIVTQIFIEGAYYGILHEGPDSLTFQQLPIKYGRTRYQTPNGVNVLEFSMKYFEDIREEEGRKLALASFPKEVSKAYASYVNGKGEEWIMIDEAYGIAFYFNDFIPFLVASIPAIIRYDQSQDREADRDEEELEKIFTNKMPVGKDINEPIFSLEEVGVIHEGLSAMMSNNKYIDVVTGFGDMELQGATASSARAETNNTAKFEQALYNEIGVSSELFNSKGNIALKYSVDKDVSMMMAFVNPIVTWVEYQINRRMADKNMSFDLIILPIAFHNRKEMTSLYVQGAQYGYSKMIAGVAYGVKQINLESMIYFENEVLHLDEKMVPLMSSHTQSGTGTEGKSKGIAKTDDISNGAGRPELPDSEKSAKTIANKESGG